MVIVMMGAPGTGKGTIASLLAGMLNIPHISTGDIFREHIKSKTELGLLAEKYILDGKLVPDEVTNKLVEDRLNMDDTKNGAILDGYPRTVAQAVYLNEMLKKSGKKVKMVVNLTTPEEEIIERIVNRRVCSNQGCKTVFNLILNPPKESGICDKCGSELITRKDDTVETVKDRLNTYFKETSPLVDYYTREGNIYNAVVSKTVNKLGKDVADDIVKVLKGE